MKIAVTGATGFIGRYLVRQLTTAGHACRCWYRPDSDRSELGDVASQLEWLPGRLGDQRSCQALVAGCEAVVHAALYHPGGGFRGGEGNLLEFANKNILGTLELIEAARSARVPRFVFISTCAVYDQILDDRPLDETHPMWPPSHYGAHKAALEEFVYSYGLGQGYPICALRPTGVYGLAHPAIRSKWFDLVQSVVGGQPVTCQRGGKEVHAADVAKAVHILLSADGIAGQAYNCYDLYVSEWDVAHLAKEMSASSAKIHGSQTVPKHQIVTQKLRDLGMAFGGRARLQQTIRELVSAVQA
jgi:nucleoside-diphosphate-sugar epimerase